MAPYWVQAGPGRIAILPRPRGGDWLAGEIEELKRAGIRAVVSALTDPEIEELGLEHEPDFCLEREMDFFSFPIEDRSVPESAAEFESLIVDLIEEVSAGRAVGIHCRAGIGRSSMIAAGVLMKFGHTADEAFKVLREARGTAVPDTREQREWIERFEMRFRNT